MAEHGTENGGRPPEKRMFSHLVSSRPPRESRSRTAASAVAVVFHAAVIALLVWATVQAATPTEEKPQEVTLYNIPKEPPPPAPPKLHVPKPPQAAPSPTPPQQAPVVPKATPKGFKTLAPPKVVMPVIPPPTAAPTTNPADFTGEGAVGGSANGTPTGQTKVTAEDVGAAPTFTPYTVAPRLKNRSEVQSALQRDYPPLLRDAGVGGTVLVWFLIDENGKVVKTQIKKSSGHDALDEAALKVADVMKFSPALNRDQKVPVWVALPVDFRTQ